MNCRLRSLALLLLLALASTLALRAQQVAFTFDDLPEHGPLPPGVTREQVITQIIQAMKQAGAPPVYGFVNGVYLEQTPSEAAVLDLWRAVGFPLGNHTWSHMNLSAHTLEEFEAEITKNEPAIRDRMATKDWHWFRFPNLAEGNTPEKRDGARAFLAAHGYRIAGVTMSFGDYLFNDPYARCMAAGNQDGVAQLEAAYLQAAHDDAAYRRAMAQALFGHDIPYVLLMHVGAFDARMLPRLLAQYKAEGFHFVTLPDAEKDPFYANDLDPRLPGSPDTLEAAMGARHVPLPQHGPPPSFLASVCK